MTGLDFLQSRSYKAQDQAVGIRSVKYLSTMYSLRGRQKAKLTGHYVKVSFRRLLITFTKKETLVVQIPLKNIVS